MEQWKSTDNPISRYRMYLEKNKLWSSEMEKDFIGKTRKEVITAFNEAEKIKKPKISEMFSDVYDTMPTNLKEQEAELAELIAKYPNMYDVSGHQS